MKRTRLAVLLAATVLALVAAGPAPGGERYEKTLNAERALGSKGSLAVENLIGSLVLRGDRTGGRARVEARVVVEAETRNDAQAIADAITIEQSGEGATASVRVAYPVDKYPAYRMPRSEKTGLLDKWVTPVLRKTTVAVPYGGRNVEVGAGRGAAAVAVYLTVTLPLDVEVSARQVVGTLQAVGLRGKLDLEVVEGEVLAEQIYGTLRARTGGGEVVVRKFSGSGLEAQTASGTLRVTEVRAERARLQTNSGEIDGSGIQAASLEVESASGTVRLEALDSVSVAVTSGSGEVDLGMKITRTREASIRTESGDVTLRVNPTTPFDLHAESTSGEVEERDLAAKVLDVQKNLLRLQRGSGGADLQVTSTSGDVMLRAL